jgi:hypothetical protein
MAVAQGEHQRIAPTGEVAQCGGGPGRTRTGGRRLVVVGPQRQAPGRRAGGIDFQHRLAGLGTRRQTQVQPFEQRIGQQQVHAILQPVDVQRLTVSRQPCLHISRAEPVQPLHAPLVDAALDHPHLQHAFGQPAVVQPGAAAHVAAGDVQARHPLAQLLEIGPAQRHEMRG